MLPILSRLFGRHKLLFFPLGSSGCRIGGWLWRTLERWTTRGQCRHRPIPWEPLLSWEQYLFFADGLSGTFNIDPASLKATIHTAKHRSTVFRKLFQGRMNVDYCRSRTY